TITWQDQFGTMTVQVRKPSRLCLPADKNAESPGAEHHPGQLACYVVKQTDATKFARVTPLYVANQFGDETLDGRASSASRRAPRPVPPRRPCAPAARAPTRRRARPPRRPDRSVGTAS